MRNSGDNELYGASDNSACQNCGNKVNLEPADLFGELGVEKTGNKTVSGELEHHGKGSLKGRPLKKEMARYGGNESDHGT